MDSRTKELSRLTMIALRCNYISISGCTLTEKGMGWFGPKINRILFNIKCFFKPSEGIKMHSFLDSIYRQEKQDDLIGDKSIFRSTI